jgi:hypothetical protein
MSSRCSVASTSSHLSSTASSHNRNRNYNTPLHSSRDGAKNRLRMSGSSGYAHGSSLGRHRPEIHALFAAKRSNCKAFERTLLQNKSAVYMRSSCREQQQSCPVSSEKKSTVSSEIQSTVSSEIQSTISSEMQSMLCSETLEGRMTLTLDDDGKLAFSSTPQTASMYNLSNPFGSTHTFQRS